MTTQNDRKNERGNPIKVTILYEDGSEEESFVFMVALARGIIPIARYDKQVFYMADGDKFSVGTICNTAATTEVVGMLLRGISDLGMIVLEGAAENPGAFMEVMKMLTSENIASIDHLNTSVVHEIRPEDN